MRYGPIIILPLAAILLTSGLRQGIKQQPESLPLTDFKFEVEEVHTPGIVKLDANRISGHVKALDSFFLKLTALEQRESDLPVTIFQLGDSHVQAGT